MGIFCARRLWAGGGARPTQGRVHPQPSILLCSLYPSLPHWVLPNVFALLRQTLVRSQHVIERFLLPHLTRSPQSFVNAVGRRALQALQDIH